MKRKRNEFVPFTEEEIELIMETGYKNLKDVAYLLKRSVDSVRRKKWMLENTERDRENKKQYRKKLQEKTLATATSNNSRWSKAEEQEVLKSNLTDIELAKKLGRTLSAIQIKRMRLLEANRARKRK